MVGTQHYCYAKVAEEENDFTLDVVARRCCTEQNQGGHDFNVACNVAPYIQAFDAIFVLVYNE